MFLPEKFHILNQNSFLITEFGYLKQNSFFTDKI